MSHAVTFQEALEIVESLPEEQQESLVKELQRRLGEQAKTETSPKKLFGAMRGTAEIVGDIVSPLDVDWEALR